MKLYDVSFSPYAARIRIQVRYKNLPIEFVPPPLPLRTPEFKARFPLGKIPILELDDGTLLPESWAIMEYLEDLFPEPALRPADPLAKARMRMVGRAADLHLSPPIFELFKLLRDANATSEGPLKALDVELEKLTRVLQEAGVPPARPMHLGDLALITALYSATVMVPLLAQREVFADFPLVAQWWKAATAHPAAQATLEEMDKGFKAFLKQIGRL